MPTSGTCAYCLVFGQVSVLNNVENHKSTTVLVHLINTNLPGTKYWTHPGTNSSTSASVPDIWSLIIRRSYNLTKGSFAPTPINSDLTGFTVKHLASALTPMYTVRSIKTLSGLRDSVEQVCDSRKSCWIIKPSSPALKYKLGVVESVAMRFTRPEWQLQTLRASLVGTS
jgi:hypothetical protein